jgi:hypothetical protein
MDDDQDEPFETIESLGARIGALARGEDLSTPVATAGMIPFYYGVDATADDVVRIWLRVWRNMEAKGTMLPGDAAFYQSNSIGWASR